MEIIYQLSTFIFHFNSLSSVNSHLCVYCGIEKQQKKWCGASIYGLSFSHLPKLSTSSLESAVTALIWATLAFQVSD